MQNQQTKQEQPLSLKKKILYGVLIYLGVVVAFVVLLILAAKYLPSEEQVAENGTTSLGDTSQLDTGQASGNLVPEWAPTLGPDDAKVTIVEFGDFKCPYCKAAHQPIRRIAETYSDDVRLVYRHFALDPIHPLASTLAHASMCAHEQGNFWPFHDRLFQYQESVTEENLNSHARAVGLNIDEFERCQQSGRWEDEIQTDLSDIVRQGGKGTPTWFVNGQMLEGVLRFSTWEEILSRFDVTG